ncbi:hypothetical protein POM88_043849 [Heracleum sosnowskyi]|uniref:Uncharacterized protein n=1 Tax=Heracleum sosnowskyi TaxID=360622 RepID=A0AAD8H1Q9_9APIA|nr:hypothetical protein POM88_043849 [Heracleum sosnowskyi]
MDSSDSEEEEEEETNYALMAEIEEASEKVISTARRCNCILIVLDAIKPITHKRLIEKELEGFGISLNKEPPNLTFRKKKEKGGINFTSTDYSFCGFLGNLFEALPVKALERYLLKLEDKVKQIQAEVDEQMNKKVQQN